MNKLTANTLYRGLCAVHGKESVPKPLWRSFKREFMKMNSEDRNTVLKEMRVQIREANSREHR